MIPRKHSLECIRRLNPDDVVKRVANGNRKRGLETRMLASVDSLSPNGKKRVCGIVKMLPPASSYTEWAGILISGRQLDSIARIIRRETHA